MPGVKVNPAVELASARCQRKYVDWQLQNPHGWDDRSGMSAPILPRPRLAACLILAASSITLAACQADNSSAQMAAYQATKELCRTGLGLLGTAQGWQKIAVYEKLRDNGCIRGPAARPSAEMQKLPVARQQQEARRLIAAACEETSSTLMSRGSLTALDMEDVATAFVAETCVGR